MTDLIITLIIINLISIYAGIRSEMKYRRQHATLDLLGMVITSMSAQCTKLVEVTKILKKDADLYKERAEVLEMHKHDLERESAEWQGEK